MASHYDRCFGCGGAHPTGLHLVIRAGEGLSTTGVFTVTEHHQGAPGLAHGGVLSSALDDVMGAVNWLLAAPAVTGRLEVDFRRPVPVGADLHMSAEIAGQVGRKVYVTGSGRLASPDGPVAIEAEALFVQVPLSHFTENGRPADVAAAAADARVRGSLSKLDLNP